MLGIDIGESNVSKYMVRGSKPPSQNWRTFLENHLSQIVPVDFFTVPTIRFEVLYGLLVLAHDRHRVIHFNVTAHPTAQWTSGAASNCERHFLLTNSRSTCREIATRSSVQPASCLNRGDCSLLALPISSWTQFHFPQLTPCTECLCRVSLATVDG